MDFSYIIKEILHSFENLKEQGLDNKCHFEEIRKDKLFVATFPQFLGNRTGNFDLNPFTQPDPT